MQFMRIIVPKRIIQDREKERRAIQGRQGGGTVGTVWEVESSGSVEFQQLQRKSEKHIVKEIRGIVRGENPLYFNPIWV